MEKSKMETTVASILRGAAGGGAVSVHVAGDVHLYQFARGSSGLEDALTMLAGLSPDKLRRVVAAVKELQ